MHARSWDPLPPPTRKINRVCCNEHESKAITSLSAHAHPLLLRGSALLNCLSGTRHDPGREVCILDTEPPVLNTVCGHFQRTAGGSSATSGTRRTSYTVWMSSCSDIAQNVLRLRFCSASRRLASYVEDDLAASPLPHLCGCFLCRAAQHGKPVCGCWSWLPLMRPRSTDPNHDDVPRTAPTSDTSLRSSPTTPLPSSRLNTPKIPSYSAMVRLLPELVDRDQA